ncbi:MULTISPECIES: hypothetical protein [unclassified Rhizobium]|uniref:hypothetical protein n=1 Tax=unclassified Rhizobium TaxID=2613769 RepID=UPI001FD7CFFC|nr:MULTISPECIES: hypothetical protein [unclassified Rhizobium]
MRHAISESQLYIRSSEAHDLNHSQSCRTEQPISRLVELALKRYDKALREYKPRQPMDVVWQSGS